MSSGATFAALNMGLDNYMWRVEFQTRLLILHKLLILLAEHKTLVHDTIRLPRLLNFGQNYRRASWALVLA